MTLLSNTAYQRGKVDLRELPARSIPINISGTVIALANLAIRMPTQPRSSIRTDFVS